MSNLIKGSMPWPMSKELLLHEMRFLAEFLQNIMLQCSLKYKKVQQYSFELLPHLKNISKH